MDLRDESKRPARLRIAPGRTLMSLGKNECARLWLARKDSGRLFGLADANDVEEEQDASFDNLCQQLVGSVSPEAQKARTPGGEGFAGRGFSTPGFDLGSRSTTAARRRTNQVSHGNRARAAGDVFWRKSRKDRQMAHGSSPAAISRDQHSRAESNNSLLSAGDDHH